MISNLVFFAMLTVPVSEEKVADPGVFLAGVVGEWEGKSKLRMIMPEKGESIDEGVSTMKVDLKGKVGHVSYTWTDMEKKTQMGYLTLAGVEAGWADSWHQSGSVMVLKGEVGKAGLNYKGTFTAPGQGDWGWRIGLMKEGEQLVMRMWISTPDGQEEWAVLGRYDRKK